MRMARSGWFWLALGALYFFIARPDRPLRAHLHDELEPTGAERVAPAD